MLWRQGPDPRTIARRDCVIFGPKWSGLGLWAGAAWVPTPKSAERQGLWAEVAAIQVDAGPLNSWEWHQEEELWLAFWSSLGGLRTGGGGS